MIDEAEDAEVPVLDVPKIDWEKYPFPQYRRIAVSEESTLMIGNDGVVHAWGANESINHVPEINECCVSVGLYYYNGYWNTITGCYNGREADVERFSIALAVGESKKLYYWGDYPDEVKNILSKIENVRCLAENGLPIILEDGYCIDFERVYKDGKYYINKKELPYNVKVISGYLHANDVSDGIYMGIGVNNRVVYENGNEKECLWEEKFDEGDKFIYASCGKKVGVAATKNVVHVWGRYYKEHNDNYGCSFSCSKFVKDVVYADYLLDGCGKIICLNKKGTFDVFDVIDICENYMDGITGEYRDKDSRRYGYCFNEAFVNRGVINVGEITGACSALKDIVSVQIINYNDRTYISSMFNRDLLWGGMVALDKDCKVYYIGSFGKDELCKQGMPDEFKI